MNCSKYLWNSVISANESKGIRAINTTCTKLHLDSFVPANQNSTLLWYINEMNCGAQHEDCCGENKHLFIYVHSTLNATEIQWNIHVQHFIDMNFQIDCFYWAPNGPQCFSTNRLFKVQWNIQYNLTITTIGIGLLNFKRQKEIKRLETTKSRERAKER